MLKELILIENNKKYQFSSKEELVKKLLGNTYFTLSSKEKLKLLTINALSNCLNTKLEPVVLDKKNKEEILNSKNKFIVYDEDTYVLSLLLTNKVTLLESKNSQIFSKKLDKTHLEGNYIILNTFAEEILKNYIISSQL